MAQGVLKWGRRLMMIGVPLMLVALELTHPSNFSKDVYQGLAHQASHWKSIHVYQSFLFGGIVVSALFLTWSLNHFWGILSKLFLWLFAVSYLVFDATAGISIGTVLEISHQNPSLDLSTVKEIVQKLYHDPIVGGSASFFSQLGSWSWLLGIGSAIVALFIENQKLPYWKLLPPLVLLGVSAYSLYLGHYPPYGPIAFASFAAASFWFELFQFGPASKVLRK